VVQLYPCLETGGRNQAVGRLANGKPSPAAGAINANGMLKVSQAPYPQNRVGAKEISRLTKLVLVEDALRSDSRAMGMASARYPSAWRL
jgi:hypothetical protein